MTQCLAGPRDGSQRTHAEQDALSAPCSNPFQSKR